MNYGKILIVDDSELNRAILADMLGEEYEILEAEDGIQALTILKDDPGEISLILLDVVMPRLDGFGVLDAMNRSDSIPDIPVVMITAEAGSQFVERAYDMGVTDFIARPFDALIVRRRVVNTLLLYAKQKRLTDMVESQIFERERQSSVMIEILSQVVEFRNGESCLHALNVRLVTEILLQALVRKTDRYSLTSEDISRISIGSALHDIGKIFMDPNILKKPGKLTKEEFEQIKNHTIRGAELLDMVPFHRDDPLLRTAYEICRWHHERYDGSGYPDGLCGDEIPISAQVVALADVYDAMITNRVYKQSFDHEEAIRMIVDGNCGVFNPLLLECLTENAAYIHREVSNVNERSIASREIENIVDSSIGSMRAGASDRTMRLLDYERMKLDFFSSITREIQFEYTVSPSMLTVNAWGAKKLGVDEVIMEPESDEKLRSVFGEDGWAKLTEALLCTDSDVPNSGYDSMISYQGKKRRHRLYLRAVWSPDVPPRLTGALGKIIDIHDDDERADVVGLNEMSFSQL